MNGPELRLRITADASQVGAEAKKAANTLNGISAAQSAAGGSAEESAIVRAAGFAGGLIGAAVFNAIIPAVRQLRVAFQDFVTEQHGIIKMSRQTGVSQETLRGGRASFLLAGSDGDSFSNSVRSLAEARARAIGGDPKAVEAFSAFGLNPNKPIDQVIRDVAAKIFSDEVTGRIRYFAKELFGSSSDEALRAFKSGAGQAIDPLAPRKWSYAISATRGLGDSFEALGLNPAPWLKALFGTVLAPVNMGSYIGSASKLVDAAYARNGVTLPPVSTYQTEREMKAREESLGNDEREYKLKLEMLSVQERIIQLLKDEEGLRRMEGSASDPVLREQIRAKRLGVAAEILGSNVTRARSYRDGGDELSKIGLFLGGPADNLPELSKQQLNELRRANAQLTRLPSELANVI